MTKIKLTHPMHNKEDGGLPLIKTLEVQTEAAPAQYQFKHLSFQEGLFAQHLLLQAEEGWEGWATDEAAASFLNNAFMNNTCRIAAGHLGSRLARRKPIWDFNTHTLTQVGLTALWLIMEFNDKVATLLLDGNDVGARADDSVGLGRAMVTAPALRKLSLAGCDQLVPPPSTRPAPGRPCLQAARLSRGVPARRTSGRLRSARCPPLI